MKPAAFGSMPFADDLSSFVTETLQANTIREWLFALGVALLSLTILRLTQAFITRRLRGVVSRTNTPLDDVFLAAICRTKLWFLSTVAIFIGAAVPELPGNVRSVLRTALVLATLLQGGLWISGGVKAWLERYAERQVDEDAGGVMTMNALGMVVRVVLWSTVLLLALDNLGVDVTALVAGLGVGGVAVALAVQNILGDLFSSLSIALDKPFVIGDFIIVGELMGSIEHIGIKTTRVRSLSGEQLVFANGDLIGSRIRNYGRMLERRVSFQLGVVYGTPKDLLEAIPAIIRRAVEEQDETRFDRSHFAGFGDFSLDFESVYYVLGADYELYMNVQQAIYLQIYEEFEDRGIEFAFPTRTILLEGSPVEGRAEESRLEERKSA